jgi:hypothetical protein
VMYPCLAAKYSHVRVDVDGLACPLHRPMAYSHQTRGWDFMSDVALSRCAAAGGGVSPGDEKSPDWDIYWRVTVWVPVSLSFYMGQIVFTNVLLPCGEALVVCMHMSLIKFPYQTTMKHIPVLGYILSGARGHLQLCLILSGNERCRLPRT